MHDSVSRLDPWISLCVLIVSVAAVATVAVWLGPDGSGDLRNYHLYGGWALTNKPVSYDIAPAQLQTYHHPLLDAMFYRLLRWLNAYPRLFTAVWSLPQGVATWMVFRLALIAFGRVADGERAPGSPLVPALAAWAIGGTGTASLPTAGMSMSEGLPALALLGAMWLVLEADRRRQAGWRYWVAGLLAGSVAVLKLTTVSFVVGIGAAIVVLKLIEPALPRGRGLLLFGLGGLISLAALGGPWWWAVWRTFGNPLYPYYNTVFHSPFYPNENLFDHRFLPQTTWEWLFYPLGWAFQRSTRVSEPALRDPRLLFELVAGLLLVGRAVLRWAAHASALVWLAVFALVSYALWLHTFSILRYASVLEMVSGIVVLGPLTLLAGRRWLPVGPLAAGLAIALIATTRWPVWERQAQYGKRLLDVTIPRVAPDSTIILVGVYEGAFLALFEPVTVRFIGLNNNLMPADSHIGLERRVSRALAEATGPLWTISDQGPPLPPAAEASLRRFGLRSTADCQPITASIAPPMRLCRAERMPDS